MRMRLAGVLCAAALLIGANPLGAQQVRRPNIVFILIDDMGWRDVGCNGSRFYETPNIDALASRGMKFTNAYAACPVCSPSRAAILTGKYPARLHITDWIPGDPSVPSQKLRGPDFRKHLPLEEYNLARVLKDAGYRSASIGKWHLGGQPFWPEHQGFDINVGGTETGSPPGGYFYFRNARIAAHDPHEYLTDRLTSEAEAFIEQNRDHPFFLYLAHYAVHIPLEARQQLIGHYAAKIRADDPQDNAIYAAMVQSVDESVGRVAKKLDDLKLSDHTLVIFTSDNGGLSVRQQANTPATSNAPLREGKGYLYEGGIREPCVICYPGVIRPGSLCDAPIIGADFYPTILDLLGLQPKAGQIVDGVSIVSLLEQTGTPERDALFWHYPHYSGQGGNPCGAVRQGDWKLIQFYEDNHTELYNLAADLGEKENLTSRYPDRAAGLQRRLQDWLKSVDAQMPVANPDFGKPGVTPAAQARVDRPDD